MRSHMLCMRVGCRSRSWVSWVPMSGAAPATPSSALGATVPAEHAGVRPFYSFSVGFVLAVDTRLLQGN